MNAQWRASLVILSLALTSKSASAAPCDPALCVPLTGCTWRPTTVVCSNTNICISNQIHNIVKYSNCIIGSCNAGCTPVGCAQSNTSPSCGLCDNLSDTPTGTSCGSGTGACGDGICGDSPGEDCVSCSADCGGCGGSCGDGICGNSSNESCLTCVPDCGSCVVGPCGPTALCGTIKDGETNTISLAGMMVEIYTDKGAIISSVKTDSTGKFSYVPTSTGNYIVSAVVGRNQNAQPLARKIALGSGNEANFKMLFIPGVLQVKDAPGTFVLFTTAQYLAPAPPPIPSPTSVYSAVVALNGLASMEVPNNYIYWVTCWRYQNGKYVKTPSKQVSGSILLPLQTVLPISCV